MFSWAFFVLFLSVGIATPCAAEATTAAPTAAPTPTTTTTTAAPTTTTAAPTTTTAAPTTTAATTTTAAPTTTTAAPTTTTAAPTTTTAAPITSTATTAAPTTSAGNVTTAAPTTTIPTTVPTTTPTPSLPTPARGTYYVSTDKNSTACLKANFGLRLSLMQGEKVREMNLDPKGINATGFCDQNASGLVLTSETITLMFNFTSETKKFQLHALTVTGTEGFSGANANLSVWQAAVGSSYMCNKEQSINITDSLALHTFDLQVQPFAVVNGGFSTAEECFLDSDLSFLVPIAVGVALSFLIILVLISYLIGRRKSRTGYQSV